MISLNLVAESDISLARLGNELRPPREDLDDDLLSSDRSTRGSFNQMRTPKGDTPPCPADFGEMNFW